MAWAKIRELRDEASFFREVAFLLEDGAQRIVNEPSRGPDHYSELLEDLARMLMRRKSDVIDDVKGVMFNQVLDGKRER